MTPVSGGTCQPDIITMWHALDGDDRFELEGIDIEKVRKAEAIFREQMADYFLPPEAMAVNPAIVWSPLPGGALTANTQILRDNNMMDKYDDMVAEMYDAVRLGGFGTSVTPVSQFYIQQAMNNVMFGKWKKIAPGYGKMVLGYFGKTPVEPDPEIVKIASEQLGLEPTTRPVIDLNEEDAQKPNTKKGCAAARKLLEAAGLPTTDENIFIAASCAEKGITFLKDPSKAPNGVRKNVAKSDAPAATAGGKDFTVTINGTKYGVSLGDTSATVNGTKYDFSVAAGLQTASAPKAVPAGGEVFKAPMPGLVLHFTAAEGDKVNEGDEVMVLEAMKMEMPMKASKAGVVSFSVAQGDKVASGDPLFSIS